MKTPQEELEHAENRIPDFARRAELHNRRVVGKARKSAGPLFADLAEAETRTQSATDKYWEWRIGAAKNGGWMNPHIGIGKALEWVRLAAIEHHASTLMDAETFALVRAFVRRVYPMPDYGPMSWADALTGKHSIPYRLHTEPMPNGLNRIVRTDTFPAEGQPPLMTREEFDALFAIPTPEMEDGGPDAEMLERFLETLRSKE